MSDENLREVPIKRDHTFSRAVADNALWMPLGRDTEVAFLAISPSPVLNRVAVEEGGEEADISGVKIQNMMMETARVRMSPASWLNLAVQIVAGEVEAGRIDLERFSYRVRQLVDAQLPEDWEEK